MMLVSTYWAPRRPSPAPSLLLVFSLPQSDQALLEQPGLCFHTRVAVQLRLAEKQILEGAVGSGRAQREHFRKLLEEDAPLPRRQEAGDRDGQPPLVLRELEEASDATLGPGDTADALLLNGGLAMENGNGVLHEGGPRAERTGDGVEENSQ